jgi:hypothetical protein
MEPSTILEAISCEATQWFPIMVCNPMVPYHIQNSPSLFPVLNQTNLAKTPILSLQYQLLFTHRRFGLPSGLFTCGFTINNLYVFLFSPIRAICTKVQKFFTVACIRFWGNVFTEPLLSKDRRYTQTGEVLHWGVLSATKIGLDLQINKQHADRISLFPLFGNKEDRPTNETWINLLK